MSALISHKKMYASDDFVKPSPVIKRLFDFSDPNETKKMLDEMLQVESNRLRSVWNFDSQSAFSPQNRAAKPGGNVQEIPKSKTCRFASWERQNRKDVPHYYSRPFHRHRSESRNSEHEPRDPFLATNAKEEPPQSLPLANRNENLQKQFPRKRSVVKAAPMFASPPRISSTTVNPSLVRFVTALRAPLPALSGQEDMALPSVTDENNPSPKRPIIDRESDSASDLPKNQAFRQLFDERKGRKRSSTPTSSRQPKITDLIPQKKTRANGLKLPRNAEHSSPLRPVD